MCSRGPSLSAGSSPAQACVPEKPLLGQHMGSSSLESACWLHVPVSAGITHVQARDLLQLESLTSHRPDMSAEDAGWV